MNEIIEQIEKIAQTRTTGGHTRQEHYAAAERSLARVEKILSRARRG